MVIVNTRIYDCYSQVSTCDDPSLISSDPLGPPLVRVFGVIWSYFVKPIETVWFGKFNLFITKQGVNGIHMMAVGWESIVPSLITEAGLLPPDFVPPEEAEAPVKMKVS